MAGQGLDPIEFLATVEMGPLNAKSHFCEFRRHKPYKTKPKCHEVKARSALH